MARSPMLPLVSVVAALSLPWALSCGGGKPATTAGGAGSEGAAGAGSGSDDVKGVVIGDAKETWYEEPGNGGDKSSGVREYTMTVTKKTEWKVQSDKALPPEQVFKVRVRFPVPKVLPVGARDPHVINRTLWEVRSEIAKCHYKGPGKEPGPEMSLVAFLHVNAKGEVTQSGVESADESLKKAGVPECILENVKSLPYPPAGDDVKVRFKLKLQTEAGGPAPAGSDKPKS